MLYKSTSAESLHLKIRTLFSFWKRCLQKNYTFDKFLGKILLGFHIGYLDKIVDFILDILTRSWILSWISWKILPRSWKFLARSWKILARSWQDIQDVQRWDAPNVRNAVSFYDLLLYKTPEFKVFSCYMKTVMCRRMSCKSKKMHFHLCFGLTCPSGQKRSLWTLNLNIKFSLKIKTFDRFFLNCGIEKTTPEVPFWRRIR